jgi:hypothetical protein
MQADDFIVTPIGDGLIIARRHGQRLYALNETARRLWACRAAGMGEARMAEELVENYGIDPDIAARDVEATLRQWRDESLIDSDYPTLSCVVGGCHMLVRLGPPDIYQAMRPLLANFIEDESTPGRRPAVIEVTERNGKYLVSTGSETSSLAPTIDAAIETIETGMLQQVFNAVDWQFSMHSAAVGNPKGCILLAGESGRGKSTLLAGLLADGFDYVADDLTLILPPHLAVLPIPMPLALKRGSWAALEARLPGLAEARVFRRGGRDVKYWVPPAERIAREPVPIRAIVFPKYGKDLPFAATRLSPFHAIERLMKAPTRIGIPLAHEAVAGLANLIEACPVYDVAYGDGQSASQWVGKLLAD